MKNFLLISLLILASCHLSAQSFYVCTNGNVETSSELSFSDNGLTLNGKSTSTVDSVTLHVPALHFVGGDLSMLPQYEAKKATYYDVNGKKISNLLTFLKEQGWNSVRVRLFVDPSKASDEDKGQGVCQDLEYVMALGRRIKEAGMLFMLDFHYSDSWADPAKQWTPDSWVGLSDEQLETKIYTYTKDCLEQMNAVGASPDFIQTGNEISYGMLWGKEGDTSSKGKNFCSTTSSANSWSRFTNLLKQAGKACREVCPRAKIVLHTERVPNLNALTNFYRKMKEASVDYDIIGLSYYSYFHGGLSNLSTALTQLQNTFSNKRVMIVEAGYYHAYQPTEGITDLSSTYPITAEGQRKFTADLVNKLKSHQNVDGLFWWWPEANEKGVNWKDPVTKSGWYNAGLFDNETGCTKITVL
jgi:arabinogalactan endo-1,4-beta-galactosidase